MGGRITRFKGPVQTGQFQGLANDPVWDVEMVARVQLSAAALSANIQLPDCDIIGFSLNVETAIAGTAQASFEVGTATDAVHYATINISAVGRVVPTVVSCAALLAQTSGAVVVVKVSTPGASPTPPTGTAYVFFRQLENLGNS